MSERPGQRFALLVEDEALIAMMVEDNLRAIGFEPLGVQTAAEALLVLARTPDLALAVIDIGLPDMRGDALAAQVRSIAPELPIVMASGYDSAQIRNRFSDEPAIAVLSKPYSENDLKQAIQALGLAADTTNGL